MKEKIIQLAKEAFKSHRDQFEDRKQIWLDMIDRYENKLRQNSISNKTDSKIALGSAFSLVENAIPRLLNKQPKYKYLAVEDEDAQGAELYDEFSEYQWTESEAESELEEVVRWGLITGLAGWKIGWKEETLITRKNAKEVMGMKISNPAVEKMLDKLKVGKSVKIDEEETTANYTITAIKPFDLIWNPEATRVKNARVLGHKEMRTYNELKAMRYEMRELTQGIKRSSYWQKMLDQRTSGREDSRKTLKSELEDIELEVAELWVKHTNEKGIVESYVVTLACLEGGDPYEIGFGSNPFDKQFIPIGVFTPIKKLGKFYGIGLIEPATGILDAEEDTLNIGVTTLWTDISRPMEYNPQNIMDINAFKYGPRQLIPVRRLGESVNVLPTPQPNINGVSYVEQYLLRAKQNVTGITDYQTGADQVSGEKTLGEIQIKTQESNARNQKVMRNLETQVIELIGKYALYLNQQFLADKKKIVFRILGKKGSYDQKEIKLKQIEAIKDVTIISGSTALVMQQAELAKWTAFLNQCYLEMKQPNPVPVNREVAWKKLIEQGMMEKDVETYLPSLKDREEKEVQGSLEQLELSKRENANPISARVMPTDDHKVHMQLHQSEIESRKVQIDAMGEMADPTLAEELQILIQHLDDHAQVAGGMRAQYSQVLTANQQQSLQEEPQQ